MTYRISTRPLRALPVVTALALSAIAIAAQDSTSATTNSAASAPGTIAQKATSQTAVQLSSGVPDVLKLSQANVSEDTIIAYVQASGRSYDGMSASEIVYLHEQGVSDSVVNAMLNQGKQLAAAAQTTQPASVTQATTEANATASAAQSPQAYAPTPVTPAQPAPAPTVYTAPNTPPVVDYGYYPGYGYYGYYYPPVSFSFGFGGGYRGGYYYGRGGHGGYHGGGYHGGGHGGGGHH